MRIRKLRERLAKENLEALWVSKPENVRYLSHFSSPDDGRVLVTMEKAFLFTDFRYIVQSQKESSLNVVIWTGNEPLEFVKKTVGEIGIRRIGFEEDHMTVSALSKLQKILEFDLIPTSGYTDQIRAVKEEGELENIRKAAELTDAGFAHILKYVRPGMKEIDVALELEFFIRKNGGKGVAFTYIVASGDRGAMPHGVASDKVINPGDLVTFDFGTSYNGYRSDMTRTIGIGDPSPKMREIYSIVLEAQLAGLQAIKAGMKCVDADAVSRNIIKDAGYGEYFGHGLGHGVGLAIHEGPRVGQYSQEVLEAGMVVTCEPGIYIPNEGGVRIEDLIVVRENGCEILSHSPKELIVINE